MTDDLTDGGSRANLLQNVLKSACSDEGCDLQDLTALTPKNDPYRQNTPANLGIAEWIVTKIEKFFEPHKRVHIRGLHYALVTQGNMRRPDGTVYLNTYDDWNWLVKAVKKARWLGYLPFERIVDQRNDAPTIHQNRRLTERGSGVLHTWVRWPGEDGFRFTTKLEVVRPFPWLRGFTREQPYALVLFGEKSSLEDVLDPIATSYGANLYIPAGEISDTLIYEMAKDGAEDGRPMVVITCCDFDPGGYQMPISIGRKLQALRDLCFPELRFEVVPAALTVEQVRDLPSTPLKPKELRASRWRQEFGHEQTEIDAPADGAERDRRDCARVLLRCDAREARSEGSALVGDLSISCRRPARRPRGAG